MSNIYDNWERLVSAVLKREQIWQLCHEDSRTPSLCSLSSDLNDSFRSTDVESHEKQDSVAENNVPQLVFIGGSNPGFRLRGALRSIHELGKGTFGITVMAELSHDVRISECDFLVEGTRVAMKLLNEVKVMEEEFKELMMVLGRCGHENVAAPRAYYFSDKANGKVVVYDYHSQGSLYDMLHGNGGHADWETRLRITIGAARGIAHIHARGPAHGNIKSSNIFLNSRRYGTMSDFDLSRIMVKPLRRGALGYHVPTHGSKTTSQETDVYAFGYMLLELLTGKSPDEAQGFEKDRDLVSWVRSVKPERWTLDLFDRRLRRPIRHEKDVLEMMKTEIPSVYRSVDRDVFANWEELRGVLGSHLRSMSRVPADYFAARELSEMREMLEVAMRCLAVVPKDRPKMCVMFLQC